MGSGSLDCRRDPAAPTGRSGFVRFFTALGIALPLLLGCGEEAPRPAEEIEAAVGSYLSGRTDLRFDRLTIRADRIRYDGDRAIASVSIEASGDPEAAMRMVYQLERGADGWRVVPMEGTPDVSGSTPPAADTASGLPPGHPPTGPTVPGLPPGHPPLTAEPD